MAISRYQKKISGPLLDRIDIHVEVPRVDYEKLADKRQVEDSKTIRARVQAARERQLERFIRNKDDLQCRDGSNGSTRVLPDRRIWGEAAEGGGAAIAFIGQGVSPGVEVGENDC
jgi:hypothetical protein